MCTSAVSSVLRCHAIENPERYYRVRKTMRLRVATCGAAWVSLWPTMGTRRGMVRVHRWMSWARTDRTSDHHASSSASDDATVLRLGCCVYIFEITGVVRGFTWMLAPATGNKTSRDSIFRPRPIPKTFCIPTQTRIPMYRHIGRLYPAVVGNAAIC